MSLALDRSLLEGLKQFSPRQKVFRCREGSMELLLDPLAVQKPCIQERSAAFRRYLGRSRGIHLDSLGRLNMFLKGSERLKSLDLVDEPGTG